jgi:hypothetical protein
MGKDNFWEDEKWFSLDFSLRCIILFCRQNDNQKQFRE